MNSLLTNKFQKKHAQSHTSRRTISVMLVQNIMRVSYQDKDDDKIVSTMSRNLNVIISISLVALHHTKNLKSFQ